MAGHSESCYIPLHKVTELELLTGTKKTFADDQRLLVEVKASSYCDGGVIVFLVRVKVNNDGVLAVSLDLLRRVISNIL